MNYDPAITIRAIRYLIDPIAVEEFRLIPRPPHPDALVRAAARVTYAKSPMKE